MICVPVIEQKGADILARVRELAGQGIPMIEWRMDWFEEAADTGAVLSLLREAAPLLERTLLLCTYRTEAQGGQGGLAGAAYEALNLAVAESGVADLVDLEYEQAREPGAQIRRLQEAGVWVVCSQHDFAGTPEQPELERQLLRMAQAGGDFTKLAVMPEKKQDVLRLMAAVLTVKEQQRESHFIAMSMGAEGAISRLTGGWYGSEVTFASLGASSAPGQIPCEKVSDLVARLEEYC